MGGITNVVSSFSLYFLLFCIFLHYLSFSWMDVGPWVYGCSMSQRFDSRGYHICGLIDRGTTVEDGV